MSRLKSAYPILSPRMNKKVSKNIEPLSQILKQLIFKKIRYTFQALKSYYQFPDLSLSQIQSFSNYDLLIYGDEILHTLVKKLETKSIQRKIWAFLNLKMLQTIQNVCTITQIMNNVVEKKQLVQKKFGFYKIKIIAAEKIVKSNKISADKIMPVKSVDRNIKIKIQQQYIYKNSRQKIPWADRIRQISREPTLPKTSIISIKRPCMAKISSQKSNFYPDNSPLGSSNSKLQLRSQNKTKYRGNQQYQQNNGIKHQYRNSYRLKQTVINVGQYTQRNCLICGNANHNPQNKCCLHCGYEHNQNQNSKILQKSINYVYSPSKKSLMDSGKSNVTRNTRNYYGSYLQSPQVSTQTQRKSYYQSRYSNQNKN